MRLKGDGNNSRAGDGDSDGYDGDEGDDGDGDSG